MLSAVISTTASPAFAVTDQPVNSDQTIDLEKANVVKTSDSPPWSPADQDIRILEIRIGRFTLEEIIAGYQYKDVVLLPLGGLSESIDLAITSSPETNSAKGFIFKTERTFFLDTDRDEVTINGIITSYDSDLVHVLLDDIYVEADLLSKWLGIKLSVNLFLSQVWITSEEPLPFEKRLEREQKIKRTLSRLKTDKKYYPRHYEPYENTSIPFVDQTVRTGIKKRSDGETDFVYNYTTHVSADLAKLESVWYITGNDQDFIEDFRLTLSRTDPESKLLGPLEATKFSFGHIFEPRVNLITQPSTLNTGFFVSNFEIGRQLEYDRHTFIGELLPDWEVEIYHNNSLLNYQSQDIDGQYRFEDVPLLYGKNHFRLVFYGPQGQQREENYHFELGDSLTKVGQHFYRTSLTNSSDGQRVIAQYNVGIKKNLSATAGFTSIPLIINNTAVQNNYLLLGLRSYYEKYFFNLDTVFNTEGGNALEFGLQTRFDDIIFGFEQTLLNDFSSEEFLPISVKITSKTRFNIDTAITTDFSPRIPIGFEISQDKFSNGTSTTNITNTISLNAHRVSYNNQLTFQQNTNLNNLIFGTLQISQYTSDSSIRGTINYGLSPDVEISNASINYEIHNFHDYRVNFGLTQSLATNTTELSTTFNKPYEEYNLGYGVRFNNNGEYSIEANFSVGIGQKPRSKQWITSKHSLAGNGSVSARVFIDVNQDGILDVENDVPLSGVGFTIDGSARRNVTDTDGVAFITSLPAYRPLDISVSKGTLEDPLWSSAIEGVRIIPRPGKTIQLDFPIFLTGEIDGTVYLETKGGKYGIGNVTVELIDANDQVVQSTQTAYDGFYIISDIPLGHFRTRIASKHLKNVRVKGQKTQSIDIKFDERYINGIDFTISR